MTKRFLTYREFLNEGLNSSRKAFLTTGKIGPEDFERLTLLDVTPTKKYLDSICRFFLEGHSEEEIKTYIDKFHTLGANLPKKDITLYSFEELKSSIDNYTSKNQKDKLVTKDIEVVYEDERFFIVRPDTFEQSAKYGRGTKWCITATDGTGQEAWERYREYLINFYFVTDKSLPSTNPLYKVAIAVNRKGEIIYEANSTVDSLNGEIDGEEYIEDNDLPREIFVPKELTVLEIWKIDLSKLKDGVYDGYIEVPQEITKFNGFEEELGLDIKEMNGGLYFINCEKLTSISNLPEKINWVLSFKNCTSLTSLPNLPETIGGDLNLQGCTSLTSISNFPEIIGDCLIFDGCTSLTCLPNLPEKVGGFLSFEGCTSLTSISKMPSVVNGDIFSEDCPFFEDMKDEEIREKYNISKNPIVKKINENFRDYASDSYTVNYQPLGTSVVKSNAFGHVFKASYKTSYDGIEYQQKNTSSKKTYYGGKIPYQSKVQITSAENSKIYIGRYLSGKKTKDGDYEYVRILSEDEKVIKIYPKEIILL